MPPDNKDPSNSFTNLPSPKQASLSPPSDPDLLPSPIHSSSANLTAPRGAPLFRLRDLMARMAAITQQGLPAVLWVEATLFAIKGSKAGLSLELIDSEASNPSQAASLRVFASQRVVSQIEAMIGCPFQSLSGADVRLLIKPSFHQRYQLQGDLRDIDPVIVEGLLAQRLEAIRQKLEDQGLYALQKALKAPADLVDLIIIHPDQSAGWADIADRLNRLETLGLLRLHNLTAAFEGKTVTQQLSRALTDAQFLVWKGSGDLVLIVRGGGAASGLAALADFDLASQVCVLDVPVVTGTGHATDRSILDQVAWKAAHTPSLALQIVLKILKRRAGDAFEDFEAICATTRRLLIERHIEPVETWRRTCREAIALCLRAVATDLDVTMQEIHGRRRALPRELALRHSQIDALVGAFRRNALAVLNLSSSLLIDVQTGIETSLLRQLDDATDRVSQSRDTAISGIRLFVAAQSQAIDAALAGLNEAIRSAVAKAETALQQQRDAIGTLSLEGTLQRGYCVALDGTSLLGSARAARACERFDLLFADGSVSVCPDPTAV